MSEHQITSGDYERGYVQALKDMLRFERKLDDGFRVVPVSKIGEALSRRKEINNRKDVVYELVELLVKRNVMERKAAELLVRGFLEVRVFDRLKLAQDLGLWTKDDPKTMDNSKIARLVFSRALQQNKIKELVDGLQRFRKRDGGHLGKKRWK